MASPIEEALPSMPSVFKKRARANRTNARRKKDEESDKEASGSSSEDETAVVKRQKKADYRNPMKQSSRVPGRNFRGLDKSDSSCSGSDDERQDKSGLLQVAFKSKKSVGREGPHDMGATATVEIDTAYDRDMTAVVERGVNINKELKGKEDDKIYRGMNNYTQYIEKKENAMGSASSKLNMKGPIRAPAHLRATIRWDYQPDICKDYKETGYCGFGDSCKFLHDRSDYKHGWQLERDWQEGQKNVGDSDSDDNDDIHKYEIKDEDDDLPFKCLLCRESFKLPVVTKCLHYFCEKCALNHYKKTQRCFVCGVQTHGIFNPAKRLIARLKETEEQNAVKQVSDDDSE